MILFILLQFFPLGLTNMTSHDPPTFQPGPRNIICLQSVSRVDNTYVYQKSNCGIITDQGVDIIYEQYWIEVENSITKNKKKLILPRDQWFKLNMDKIYCIDSLDTW